MNEIRQKLVKVGKLLRGFLPKHLPVNGYDALDSFCSDIIETYDLPNLPSYRHAIASMIMHLPPTTIYKSPRYFAVSVKKAMANQVAYEMIQRLRDSDKPKQGEATPNQLENPPNEPVQDSQVQDASAQVVSKT